MAHYVAGLSVECLFRAYRRLETDEFDERHELRDLVRTFYRRLESEQLNRQIVGEALGTVVARWLNNHRYRSEDELRKFLKRRLLDRRIKGDFLKENSRRIVDAAQTIVGIGDAQWNSLRRFSG